LTSFALYEAYGTRPFEWGDDPDRQKANTKEEETDLGLLNEGMRYRDLETGVFLTRDPIGYGDGPNLYCYVHCNPITRFDPFGLKWEENTIEDDDGNMHTDYTFTASVEFDEELHLDEDEKRLYYKNIKKGIEDSFTSEFQPGDKNAPHHTWSINVDLRPVSSAKDARKDNHIILVTSHKSKDRRAHDAGMGKGNNGCVRLADMSTIYLDHANLKGNEESIRSVAGHEAAHTAGLIAPNSRGSGHDNDMLLNYKGSIDSQHRNLDGTYGSVMTTLGVEYLPEGAKYSRELKLSQVEQINDCINGRYANELRPYNGVNKYLAPGKPKL
jgi:RHS repeat-associated protein